jgi:hypothetical protein
LRRCSRAILRGPAVVLVECEAGVGKTRLVWELADRPELDRHHGFAAIAII